MQGVLAQYILEPLAWMTTSILTIRPSEIATEHVMPKIYKLLHHVQESRPVRCLTTSYGAIVHRCNKTSFRTNVNLVCDFFISVIQSMKLPEIKVHPHLKARAEKAIEMHIKKRKHVMKSASKVVGDASLPAHLVEVIEAKTPDLKVPAVNPMKGLRSKKMM